MMDLCERGKIRNSEDRPLAGTLPQELFGADRRTSHGSKKKKLSGAQRKCLRKQKEALYNSSRLPEVFNILTQVFIVPW